MKRAFDIFALKSKKGDPSRAQAINKAVNKDEGLPLTEPERKRMKQFELSDAQKQRQQVFREVVSFGEKGLEGEAAEAATYRWKKALGIPMKKVTMPYPELKRKLHEKDNKEAAEKVKRQQGGLPYYTRAPVIAHKKPKPPKKQVLEIMPGKYRKGAVELLKRDISRIYDDVKKRPRKFNKNNKSNTEYNKDNKGNKDNKDNKNSKSKKR